jgi:hypothetical protein
MKEVKATEWQDWLELPEGIRIKKTMVLYYRRREPSGTSFWFKDEPTVFQTKMPVEEFDKAMGKP